MSLVLDMMDKNLAKIAQRMTFVKPNDEHLWIEDRWRFNGNLPISIQRINHWFGFKGTPL